MCACEYLYLDLYWFCNFSVRCIISSDVLVMESSLPRFQARSGRGAAAVLPPGSRRRPCAAFWQQLTSHTPQQTERPVAAFAQSEAKVHRRGTKGKHASKTNRQKRSTRPRLIGRRRNRAYALSTITKTCARVLLPGGKGDVIRARAFTRRQETNPPMPKPAKARRPSPRACPRGRAERLCSDSGRCCCWSPLSSCVAGADVLRLSTDFWGCC